MLGKGLRVLALAVSVVVSATAATAQEPTAAPILIVDQERLFEGSTFGERMVQQVERLSAELAAENREIEERLVAEELDITERRPTLTPAEFQDIANAFDEKVQSIRAAQDAKSRELQRLQDEQRQSFLRQITPILAEIVNDRKALVVLDRRAVFLSSQAIDITDEAIARINAAFEAMENGEAAPEIVPEPEQSTPPEQP